MIRWPILLNIVSKVPSSIFDKTYSVCQLIPCFEGTANLGCQVFWNTSGYPLPNVAVRLTAGNLTRLGLVSLNCFVFRLAVCLRNLCLSTDFRKLCLAVCRLDCILCSIFGFFVCCIGFWIPMWISFIYFVNSCFVLILLFLENFCLNNHSFLVISNNRINFMKKTYRCIRTFILLLCQLLNLAFLFLLTFKLRNNRFNWNFLDRNEEEFFLVISYLLISLIHDLLNFQFYLKFNWLNQAR